MFQQTASKFTKLLALLLAVVLLLSACGGESEVSSDVASQTESAANDGTNDASDQTESTASDTASANNNSASTKTSTPTTGNNNNNGGSSGKYTWGKDPYADIPAAIKKKEIHVLMWREYNKPEKQAIEGFTKKTGIKIRTTVTSDYSTKLMSLISGKDSPDVVAIESYDFPSYIVRALQPLNKKAFRLDDACWNKAYMDTVKVNGNYYAAGVSGSWWVEDCLYVTYYNPKVLKKCGVSATPSELYEQGKWNWDTQHDIAEKMKKEDASYIGISLQNPDLFMLSAGVDFTNYNGKEFSNNLGNVKSASLLTKSWQEAASLYSTGLATEYNLSAVQQGKCGLFSSITYAMLEDVGGFSGMGFEAVPCAGPSQSSAYVPARPKLWGVARGAKNPEGAAYFIRYCTDPKNCDMDASFENKQFQKTFNLITGSKTKKKPLMSYGITNYNSEGEYWKFIYALTTTTEANITSALNAKKGTLDAAIKRANKDLSRLG